MEIRAVNNNTDILQALTRNNEALNFKQGDVVVAEIVAINGETIALRTGDDLLLTGKLLGELEFTLGEHIEFEVAGKSGDKFILQTMATNMDSVEISTDSLEQAVSSRESIIISSLLNNLGINANQEMVDTILSAIKENPNLDVKSAIFMFVNDIAFTKENVQTIRTLESNVNSMSDSLSNILNQMILDKAFPDSNEAKAHLQQVLQAEANQLAGGFTQVSGDNAQTGATKTVVSVNEGYYSVSTETAMPGDLMQSEQPVNIEGHTQQSGNENFKAMISSLLGSGTARDSEMLQNNTSSADNAGYASALANISEDKSLQVLLPKILSLFTEIKDIKNGKDNIKQIDKENVQKLIQLKDAIKNSDIKNRNILATKAEELVSQNKVMSEVKRFNFYNIPINFGNNQQTAEVYVYKRKNKKKIKTPGETSILVGLDTQNLGRFEVLIKAEHSNLSIKMSREIEVANEVIELRINKLRKSFSEMGYNLSSFKIEKLLEKTTVANAEQVLSGGVGSSSKIDYII